MRGGGETRTVVVADAERNTSLCVARSLAGAGYRVVAVGAADATGGGAMRSASIARAERVAAGEGSYADAVVAVARREGAVAVSAHYERTLLDLHRRLAGAPPVVVGAGPRQLELCARKSRVLEAARRVGVPVPDTRLVDAGTPAAELAAEARSLAQAHGWPLFAKADSEHGIPPGRDSRYIVLEGEDDLPRFAAFVRERGAVLLQERIAGRGCGIAGVFVRGAPACVGGHVRLREAHASGGVSTYCEARIVGEALHSASRLLEALDWSGVAMVEFKLPRAGPPVLMEVNPRLWGTLPLYVRAGADVPLAALELALRGRVPTQERRFEEGRRMRFLLPDLVAIRGQHRGLRRLAELARAVAETPWIVPEATFSVRDPVPFLVELADQASASLRRRLARPPVAPG